MVYNFQEILSLITHSVITLLSLFLLVVLIRLFEVLGLLRDVLKRMLLHRKQRHGYADADPSVLSKIHPRARGVGTHTYRPARDYLPSGGIFLRPALGADVTYELQLQHR